MFFVGGMVWYGMDHGWYGSSVWYGSDGYIPYG
jgi:hypothetical protein